MIVEHSFVTTRPAIDLLTEAKETLAKLGFIPEPSHQPGEVTAQRGCRNPRRAADVTRLPQRARVVYDRGLVMVAASVEPKGRERAQHRELLLSLALAIEERLAGAATRQAVEAWQQFNARIKRRTRIRNWSVAAFIALIGAAIIFAVVFGGR
jgi:hypothetical protein